MRPESKREWDRRNPRRAYKRAHEARRRRESEEECKGGCGRMVATLRAARNKFPGFCASCARRRKAREEGRVVTSAVSI